VKKTATRAARLTWIGIGVAAIALGSVGVVLPLLPTTPFVLVAAFAFAKSSDRLHNWLVNHYVFGPLIDDWNRYGAISMTTKVVAILSMAGLLVISILLAVPTHLLVTQAVVLSACALFVASRPLPRK
jgi:uncharacterized membrane protein YbaN (DUF454 family)